MAMHDVAEMSALGKVESSGQRDREGQGAWEGGIK